MRVGTKVCTMPSCFWRLIRCTALTLSFLISCHWISAAKTIKDSFELQCWHICVLQFTTFTIKMSNALQVQLKCNAACHMGVLLSVCLGSVHSSSRNHGRGPQEILDSAGMIKELSICSLSYHDWYISSITGGYFLILKWLYFLNACSWSFWAYKKSIKSSAVKQSVSKISFCSHCMCVYCVYLLCVYVDAHPCMCIYLRKNFTIIY